MSGLKVRAVYDFEAQPGTGELSIREGEILSVIRQDVGDGWWEGTNALNQSGLFPAAYVEEFESDPPSVPPPPLPPSYANTEEFSSGWESNVEFSTSRAAEQTKQYSHENDDWDDDWDDDDDSETGASSLNGTTNYGFSNFSKKPAVTATSIGDISLAGRESKGTVKKSFNRFSTLAKTGVEDFLVGATRANVEEKDKVFIIEGNHGPQWKPPLMEFTCAISSPKKESKYHGIKSFIAYTITPSGTNQPVMRRYKHFDWLQERLSVKFPLIPIPPLPEKQISGRFEDDLIEYRMTMLQSWVDRICRHPVLSQCEVFQHFITCPNDEKIWKAGKRKAETDKLIGANFYLAIERPEKPLDRPHLENKVDGYSRFFSTLDEAVKLLQNTCIDQSKKYQGGFKREYSKISHSFSKLSRAFDIDPSDCCPELTESIHHVSTAYSDVAHIFEEEPKHDWEPLNHLLYEYKGILEGFPTVISVSKGAVTKCKQTEKDMLDGKVDKELVPPIVNKADTIAYALQAEVHNFNLERRRDFKNAMTHFLTEQISFYQKVQYNPFKNFY